MSAKPRCDKEWESEHTWQVRIGVLTVGGHDRMNADSKVTVRLQAPLLDPFLGSGSEGTHTGSEISVKREPDSSSTRFSVSSPSPF
jgi:hypothetical protein